MIKKRKNNKKILTKIIKGFSLMEIIITISVLILIIAILIILLNPKKQLDKAWDTQRKHDLVTILGAMEDYYNDTNMYPQGSDICFDEVLVEKDENNNDICNCHVCGKQKPNSFPPYLTKLPCDPQFPQRAYLYQYECTDRNWYKLYSVLSNNLTGSIISKYNYGVSSPNIQLGLYPLFNTGYLFYLPTSVPSNTPVPPTNVPIPTPTPCWRINGVCDVGCNSATNSPSSQYQTKTLNTCTRAVWKRPGDHCTSYSDDTCSSLPCTGGGINGPYTITWYSDNNCTTEAFKTISGNRCNLDCTGTCFGATQCEPIIKTAMSGKVDLPGGFCNSGPSQQEYRPWVQLTCSYDPASYYTLSNQRTVYSKGSACSANGSGNCYKITSPGSYYSNCNGCSFFPNCDAGNYYATSQSCSFY